MNAFAIRGAALGAFVNVFGVLPLLGQGSLTVLRWENIGPGGGGAYYEAAWHPTKPDVLLVGSDVGGLYKSTNNAASWRVSTKIDPSQTWREQASIYTVERLAYAPSSPDLVFAACWRGVFRSADGGETWKKLIDAPFPNFYGAVAVDPQDANIVLVASGGRYQYSPYASALGLATPYTAPAGYYW
ncbi:MAG: exo-alpha-sialidase, partial [Chloroflexi bacterium]|nr:exo-alpha-sialidase [Chloroflexota bacterium]